MPTILVAILICLGTAAAAERPNVVFILADDLGFGDFSCYGAERFETPACDRLAAQGMRFTDAHSPSAVCSPTRYAVLTGRYAWRSWLKNWVLQGNHPLLIDADRLTMGDLFQKAGYKTGCIGKWHLGWGTELGPDFSGEVRPGPLEVGFHSFFGVPFSHNSSKPQQVYMRDRRIVNLKPGLDYRSKEAMADTVRSLEDTAIDLSREAVAFVDRHKDEPFFLFYPTTNIHFPITPNPRFVGKTRAGAYGEFVIEFDWAVGELLDALDRNGIADKTVVIVTSDNGGRPPGKSTQLEEFGDHACNGPWRGTKRMIYEGGHRVPLIVHWPGKTPAGAVSDETVCLTDFFATFASLLGQAVPGNAGEDSDDISAYLGGQSDDKLKGRSIIHHSVSGLFAIRQGEWKLVEGSGDGDYPRNEKGKIDVKRWNPERDSETGEWTELDYFQLEADGKFQLYNLSRDPKEEVNLADKHPDKVLALKRELDRVRDRGRSRRP